MGNISIEDITNLTVDTIMRHQSQSFVKYMNWYETLTPDQRREEDIRAAVISHSFWSVDLESYDG